jgi:hypothetical protein
MKEKDYNHSQGCGNYQPFADKPLPYRQRSQTQTFRRYYQPRLDKGTKPSKNKYHKEIYITFEKATEKLWSKK